ncbi:D-alanyl-D-alanine carboxypeptidase [Azospirillaceae bacterium]
MTVGASRPSVSGFRKPPLWIECDKTRRFSFRASGVASVRAASQSAALFAIGLFLFSMAALFGATTESHATSPSGDLQFPPSADAPPQAASKNQPPNQDQPLKESQPQAESAPLSPTQAALNEILERYRLPGGVLLVSTPTSRNIAAAGLADIGRKIPITPDTRFHSASAGKMVTATAILQMIQEERLALTDLAMPLLAIPEAARLANLADATIDDLITHHSGIPDCFRNSVVMTSRHPSPVWSAVDVLREAHCREPSTAGEFEYSNTNFIILGHIIEILDKRSFAEALTERVLKPAGMTSTTVAVDASDPRLARGYRRPDSQGKRKDASLYAWSSPLGDAPITTTAEDLEKFLKALLSPGGSLLKPETVKDMIANRLEPDDDDDDEGYGLGIEVEKTEWGTKIGHSGRLGGFSAEAWHYPAANVFIVLLVNGDFHDDENLLEPVEHRFLTPVEPTSSNSPTSDDSSTSTPNAPVPNTQSPNTQPPSAPAEKRPS